MFCDKCGTRLNPGAQFCMACGKAVFSAPTVMAPGMLPGVPDGRVRRHIHRLATLWLISGILRLTAIGGFFMFSRMFLPFMHGWMGRLNGVPWGPWNPEHFLSGSFVSIGILLAFFGVLHFVLAWGLFERQPWARVLGLVLGVLALFRLPFGTALGIYTLWVLAPEHSAREYDQLSHSGGQLNTASVSS